MINVMTFETHDMNFLRLLSASLGWTYFICWSLSFYPQPIHNFQRRSTRGLVIDFPTANVLGFLSLSVANSAFAFSSLVRAQYAFRHPLSPVPTVQGNDVAYAVHGLAMCIITYSQFWPRLWRFAPDGRPGASRLMLGICSGGIVAILIVMTIVLATSNDSGQDPVGWAWIEVVCNFPWLLLDGVSKCPN